MSTGHNGGKLNAMAEAATNPSNVLASARDYEGSAVVALLESYAPLVHRLAHALCGDARTGNVIAQTVMRRALRVLPRWRDEAEADRWFYHYTVLETRGAPQPPPGAIDPLLAASARNDAPFVALLRAVRALPPQQREAILLHHGEHLNPRYLAVAMDCSAEAAANHLRIATLGLRQLVGTDAAAPLLNELGAAYQRLSPDLSGVGPAIRREVRRFLVPRRVRRIVILLLLLVIAWAIFRGWHVIRSLWGA